MHLVSLVPGPKEEEEGPGFSCSHMHLIITDSSTYSSVGGAEKEDGSTMEPHITSCDCFTGR